MNIRPDLDATLVDVARTYDVHLGLRELHHAFLLKFLDCLYNP